MSINNPSVNIGAGMRLSQERNSIVLAFSFDLNLPFSKIKEELENSTNLTWHEKDSEFYGDYLSTRTPSDSLIRIFQDNGRYMFDLKLEGKFPESKPQAEAEAFKTLLNSLGAKNFKSAENNY